MLATAGPHLVGQPQLTDSDLLYVVCAGSYSWCVAISRRETKFPRDILLRGDQWHLRHGAGRTTFIVSVRYSLNLRQLCFSSTETIDDWGISGWADPAGPDPLLRQLCPSDAEVPERALRRPENLLECGRRFCEELAREPESRLLYGIELDPPRTTTTVRLVHPASPELRSAGLPRAR